MYKAKNEEITEIFEFYKYIVEYMNTQGLALGWDIEKYPDLSFVTEMVNKGEMFIERADEKIICAAAVNHNMNPEYDDIDWEVKGPKDKISSIHALAVSPEYRKGEKAGAMEEYDKSEKAIAANGKAVDFTERSASDKFLCEIENLCRKNGDLAIHFDVIDFNIPAYKLYMRNGYSDLGKIEMYYEVVGYKNFYMIEKVL